ncbi:hypothetical protein [Streptococcus suis]|uniref:hypothetical protein n=1 Tax=Streptococcus suis TaxID=1307 RepID=UPI0037579FCB
MIQRYRAFYEGKMYGVKAVIWTSRGLYVTLDEGNKAGRRVRSAKLMQSTGKMDSTGKVVGNIYQNKDLVDYILGDRK